MAYARRLIMLAIANLLLPIGVVVFLTGYFRGTVANENLTDEKMWVGPQTLAGNMPEAPFNKVIFMLVDALRSDFVFADTGKFDFTHSLIRSGAAMPYTGLAALPTLTVSRIKALTLGTGQSLLDIWLNIAHDPDQVRSAAQDTWLARLKMEYEGQKLVFAGPDDWVSLYPGLFDREHVFPSFYLPDFSSEDANITRILPEELSNNDWVGFVMHFLGLDNLAHFGGTSSAHMPSKQAEMDAVVKIIYESLETQPHLQNTLFVLLGDHGMTSEGNHGGDSPAETSAAMVFISPHLKGLPKKSVLTAPLPHDYTYKYYSVIDQTDLVPSLAGLLGFQTPPSSIGHCVRGLLEVFYDPQQQVEILQANAIQLINTLKQQNLTDAIDKVSNLCILFEQRSDQYQQGIQFLETSQPFRTEVQIALLQQDFISYLEEFCHGIQQLLLVPRSNLHPIRLAIGVGCLCLSLVLLYRTSFSKGSLSMKFNMEIPFLMVSLCHFITIFIPCLVAEEHHFWYWASLTWLSYIGLFRGGTSRWTGMAIFVVALQYLSQCVNQDLSFVQTGRIEDFMHRMAHIPIFMWVCGSLTYFHAGYQLSSNSGLPRGISNLLTLVLLLAAVLHKIVSTYHHNPELLHFLPLEAQSILTKVDYNAILHFCWAGLMACFICGAFLRQWQSAGKLGTRKAKMKLITEIIKVYLRIQAKPRAFLLFIIFDIELEWLVQASGRLRTPSEVAFTALLLGQSAFFAQGRDNSFNAMDFTNIYNGLDGTKIVPVFLQAMVSNWVGPLWWSMAALQMLLLSTATESPTSNPLPDVSPPCYTRENERVDGMTPQDPTRSDKGRATFRREREPQDAFEGTEKQSGFMQMLKLQTLFSVGSSLALMFAVVVWRKDGVLWSVYTPKYINAVLWAGFHHALVQGVICSLLWVLVAVE